MDIDEVQSDISLVNKWLSKLFSNLGVSEQWIDYVKLFILLALVITIAYLLQYVVKKVLVFVFKKITSATPLSFFNYAVNNKLPYYLALVIPYSFVRASIPVMFEDFPALITPSIKITDIYIVFMVIWTVMALIRSLADVVQEKPAFHNKPFKSYLQVINIIFYIIGAIAIYSILTGHSATGFFAAMGAASAVLMLMFKDTIMGFVASIQLSSNKMVQIGDWITMNKYGADGTVDEINLTTVKVINFDKTITTIPTYALISDSFQNWRGMKESGGRRFKRVLSLNQSDVRFMTDDELEKMKNFGGLKEYIEKKQSEYTKWNKDLNIDKSFNYDGHRITNSDLFIQYATWYLRNHPKIHKEMTLMVRTLNATPEGLPVELYSFTNTTVWAEYEVIVLEIVNHLLGVIKAFDLRIYTTTASDPYDIYIKEFNSKQNALLNNNKN